MNNQQMFPPADVGRIWPSLWWP